jgi:microcystin degradation protein MlrC
MPSPLRIAVAGFQHESHSFTGHRADFAYFVEHRDRPPLVRGREILDALEGGSYALSGFMAAKPAGSELVPLVWASGGAGGNVTSDAFERIVGEMVGDLSRQMPVDAVYLDLHGAMVSQDFDDAEAEMLRRVRAVVGPAIPVVISLDYHANISPEMARLCDGMAVFRTYPHVDRPDTGRRAAQILQAILGRGIPAGRAIRKTPFLLPLDFQCTLVDPSASVVNWAPADAKDIASVSYAAGFPPSDTVWCGPSVVVHAWTQQAADEAADAYLAHITALESAFALPLWSTADGVREAVSLARTAQRPIVIADTQDNPGAGGSGDTTGILQALLDAGAEDAMAGYFCDAAAAKAAHEAGEGASIDLCLGQSRDGGSPPLCGRFEVVRCTEGPFRMSGSVAGNVTADLGPMALLRRDGLQVAVTSRRVQAYDPAPFHRLGVDPSKHRIVVLKSSCHFRADFGGFAQQILSVLAPGAYDPDPAHYPYTRLRAGVRYKPGRPEMHPAA